MSYVYGPTHTKEKKSPEKEKRLKSLIINLLYLFYFDAKFTRIHFLIDSQKI